jgi:hypothetical protein
VTSASRALMVAAVLAVPLWAGGCGDEPAMQSPVVTHSAPAAFGLSARQVVDSLANHGLVVLHPVDTTSADCATVGCTQAVTTDRFRVLSFGSTGAAQKYAADGGYRQVENVVVTFAPPVPDAERDDIWASITKVMR